MDKAMYDTLREILKERRENNGKTDRDEDPEGDRKGARSGSDMHGAVGA